MRISSERSDNMKSRTELNPGHVHGIKNCPGKSRTDGHLKQAVYTTSQTSCARGDTICPRPSPDPVGAQGPRAAPSRRNVAVVSHAQYVLTVTAVAASRVKAALSKAAW